MPLNARNTRNRHRVLYGGQAGQTIILYKRQDDQQSGTQKVFKLFCCKKGRITKTGQPIKGKMTSNERTTWMIPLSELQRCGIGYINALDRIYDPKGTGTWMPESDTVITVKMFGNVISIDCKSTDPVR